MLRSVVYEPNRVRLDFSYAPVICLHVNHLYPELDNTIKDFESYHSVISRIKIHNRMRIRKDNRVKLGPVPAQAKVLQMQRRPGQSRRPHIPIYILSLVFSHIFTPISHPSALLTPSLVASDGPEQGTEM